MDQDNHAAVPCPTCGNDDIDTLVWDDDVESDFVTCHACRTRYNLHPRNPETLMKSPLAFSTRQTISLIPLLPAKNNQPHPHTQESQIGRFLSFFVGYAKSRNACQAQK